MTKGPRLRPPLIGREEQLERMMAKLAYALAGQGLTILISGEAGVGKTRLAEEFEVLATSTQCVCVNASCALEGSSYAPFREAMSRLSGGDPSLAKSPAFHDFCLSKEVGGDGDKDERALFTALDVLRWVSERFPLVLRVDDLQLADARTIQLLHFLARGIGDRRVLIIGTYSDDELFDRQERPHPLIETVRIMMREGLCEEVHLGPLSKEEMAQALNALLEAKLEQTALDSLYRESGGNLQIAVELTLEALRSGSMTIEEDRASMVSWRSLGIPMTLREWVCRKLDALPEEHLELLEGAALSGECFDAEMLSQVLGRPKLEILELLDAGVRQYRLYVEAGERYLLRWGVVRRVCLDRIPPDRAHALRTAIETAKAARQIGA